MTKFKVPSSVRSNNISSIVEELKTLHDSLSKVEQDEFESIRGELDPVAIRLVSSELVNNADKTVKLLNSCCIANILRLYAPDAPYSPEQLSDIFTVVIQQLKHLSDSKNAYQSYVFYLVESLATVKSVVLLLDVDDTKGNRERLLQQLFGLVFDLAPIPTVSRTAKLYLLEIAQTLIDEADTISSDIVRCIIQKCGDLREETRLFAADLVRQCSDKLQPAFGLFFNEAVIAYSSDREDQQQKRIEPLRQIHTQIIQVGRVAPTSIASVVAQLEDELQTIDSELRYLAVSSLASFFTSPEQDAPKLYPHLWQSWLNKMNDKVPSIRAQWAKLAISMLHEIPLNYRPQLQSGITEKLQDIDPKVREKTILLLQKYIEEGNPPLHLGVDMIDEIGSRCRDKVSDVHLVAVDLLCLLIHKLFAIDPYHQCFSLTVNALFKLIYTTDRDLRLFYEYFIEHGVMIPKLEGTEHARFLVCMFRVLGDEAHRAFKKWLNDKSIFVKYFDAYLKISSINPDDQRLEALNLHLANLYRVPLPAQTMLKALPFTFAKDSKNFELLKELVLPDRTVKRQKELVETLSAVKWEKKDARIKEYLMTYTIRRASLLSVNSKILNMVLNVEERNLQSSAHKLIADIIAEFPSLGIDHAEMLQESIIKGDSTIDGLLTYSRFASTCADKIKPSEEFLNHLNELIRCGDRRQAKYASRILLAFKDCWPELRVLHDHVICDDLMLVRNWQILAELANQPDVMNPMNLCVIKEKAISLFQTHFGDEKYSKLELDMFPSTVITAILSIRCIRNLMLALRAIDRDQEMEQLCLFAPFFVDLLNKISSERVRLALGKALIGFVPRPTAKTMILNLAPLIHFAYTSSPIYRDRLHSFILRQYQMGHIGMIYLALPILAMEHSTSKTPLKESLTIIKKSDRFTESILPHDDTLIDINSRSLRRYEDWVVVVHIIAALLRDDLDESCISYYTALADFLVDLIASEHNISYLFDAIVQLKRYEFIEEYRHKTKHLYVLSELTQSALRSRANSHKWQLQSVKSPISLTDDLLKEFRTPEEVGKNVQRSYLIKATQQIEKNRKSDEAQRKKMSDDFPTKDCCTSTTTSNHSVFKENDSSNNNTVSQEENVGKRPMIRRSARNTIK